MHTYVFLCLDAWLSAGIALCAFCRVWYIGSRALRGPDCLRKQRLQLISSLVDLDVCRGRDFNVRGLCFILLYQAPVFEAYGYATSCLHLIFDLNSVHFIPSNATCWFFCLLSCPPLIPRSLSLTRHLSPFLSPALSLLFNLSMPPSLLRSHHISFHTNF